MNMTVGILTACRTNNFGTDLQAYAMQELFSRYFEKVEIINYKCEKLENSRKIFVIHNFRDLIHLPWKIRKCKIHDAFRARYFRFSTQEYDKNTLKNCDYDMMVVGSDQIWNLNITGNDLNFFLPFETSAFKVAYAPSIGKNSVREWNDKYHLGDYLSEFSAVSIREDSGINALAEIGVKAKHCLDPLLMIEKEKWNRLSNHVALKGDYIFIYVVDRIDDAVNKARVISKKTGYRIVLCGNPLKHIQGVQILRNLSVQDWILYMKSAALIITNSYHGLSFAINFQKDFMIPWITNKQSNIRLENILKLLELQIYEHGDYTQLEWEAIDKILEKKRESSVNYICELMKLYDERTAEENSKKK